MRYTEAFLTPLPIEVDGIPSLVRPAQGNAFAVLARTDGPGNIRAGDVIVADRSLPAKPGALVVSDVGDVLRVSEHPAEGVRLGIVRAILKRASGGPACRTAGRSLGEP